MSEAAIILASSSSSRRAMLTAAGVNFAALSPEVDEETLTKRLTKDGADAETIAGALADAKALSVSARHAEALVLGADQVLICGEELVSKAVDEAAARRTLRALRGTEHTLISVAVLAKAGTVIWRRREAATLHMRDFSDAFLEDYLAAEMPDILGSVGCYRIEGRGAQLFEHVEGDQFCIRGLPLIAVLAALRQYGALVT